MKSLTEKVILMFRKRRLRKQIKKASMKVREESLKMTKEFDNAISDGLEKW